MMENFTQEEFLLDYPVGNNKSQCGIKMIQKEKKQPVIICTQLPEKTKGSVQVSHELIRKKIATRLKVEQTGVTWIEHWPKGSISLFKDEKYFLVPMDNNHPEWKGISKKEVDEIIESKGRDTTRSDNNKTQQKPGLKIRHIMDMFSKKRKIKAENDQLTRHYTAFKSLRKLCNAKGGYFPSLQTETGDGNKRKDLKKLADYYDFFQAKRCDMRRVNRF